MRKGEECGRAMEGGERVRLWSRQSVGVIKDMRGDRDGLARTPVKVLMVAGHAAFLFKVCVCVCDRGDRGKAGRQAGREITVRCVGTTAFMCFLRQCKVAV